jgi:hypothetical protein
MSLQNYIPKDIMKQYEVHEFKHAAAIAAKEFPGEFLEICSALRTFSFSLEDITAKGGNESEIPKKLSDILRPQGWNERNLEAELSVYEVKGKDRTLKNIVNHGTHKVDYIKNRVAFDLEWNSKDQTFDRDLYAFRAFFEYDAISLGILLTRSNNLDPLFKELGIMSKYGASTTHMSKLIPRLEAGRNGGCPILVFGITQHQIANLQ